DGNVVLSATQTTDAGVSYEVVWSQRIEPRTVDVADGGAAELDVALSTIQQASLAISSADMGTLYLGNADDDAPGMLDGALGSNKDIEGNSWYSGNYETASYQTPLDGGGNGITWISPSIGGFKVGTSYFPGEDSSSYAATYSAGGISVYYGSNQDSSNMAVSGTIAGFTVATGVRKVDGSTNKATDMAVSYTLDNGIKIAALTAQGTNSTGTKSSYKNVGASYSMAPGVTLKVEAGDDMGTNFTFIGVNTSF
ncbi:MAG: porin, partial [Alphaproteobacteria bacterium]|nr:porin [Alphaproteobacteria bacterium]